MKRRDYPALDPHLTTIEGLHEVERITTYEHGRSRTPAETKSPRSQYQPKPPRIFCNGSIWVSSTPVAYVCHCANGIRQRTGPVLAKIRGHHVLAVCDARYDLISTDASEGRGRHDLAALRIEPEHGTLTE